MFKKARKSRQSGCQRKFVPYSPTILTKCTQFSSRALNFRFRMYDQIGDTLKFNINKMSLNNV